MQLQQDRRHEYLRIRIIHIKNDVDQSSSFEGHRAELYKAATGWHSAHSLAERATVNSFEPWIKVSVDNDCLISGLATISATIRHVTSVPVVQVLTGDDRWSLPAIERVILSTKKKEQHEFAAKTYSALEELERKISHVHQSV